MSHTSHPLLEIPLTEFSSLCLDSCSLPSSPPKGEYTRFKETLLETVEDALQEDTLLSIVQKVITENKAVQTSFIIDTPKEEKKPVKKTYSFPTIQIPVDSNETLCEVMFIMMLMKVCSGIHHGTLSSLINA
jgi:hypothetical protein